MTAIADASDADGRVPPMSPPYSMLATVMNAVVAAHLAGLSRAAALEQAAAALMETDAGLSPGTARRIADGLSCA